MGSDPQSYLQYQHDRQVALVLKELSAAIALDVEHDGPVVVWEGVKFPGGRLRGITTSNLESYFRLVLALRGKRGAA